MALLDIIKKSPGEDPNKLNSQELELIIQLLRQANIKGEHIEIFYNLVVKLQNQHTEQSKLEQ
jgi:hypothetical protein